MLYPIVKFGDPVLEKLAAPITVFDDELRKLVEDMFESMYAAHGVGLAAPQIGISKRVAVIDVSFKEDPGAKIVLINPEIIHTEGRLTSNEGCLSLPEFREKVTRPRSVTRSTTLPRQRSAVSTALITAGIDPVWPTMSGFAKLTTQKA